MNENDGDPGPDPVDATSPVCAFAPGSFELLARLCPDGVLVSLDDRIVYASPGAEAIFCPPGPGGLLGRAPLTLAAPEYQASLRVRMAQAAAGAVEPLKELALYRADGRRFDAELACGPFTWSGHSALQLLVRDISERKRTQTQLRASDSRLASELEEMNRLHELSNQLLATRDLRSALDEVLDAAITLLDADYGNIQLYNPHKKGLEIVVQRGFPQAFLDTFRLVGTEDDTACGRALRSGARIIIEDVLTDEEYTNCRDIAAAAGYRAVQSTPLLVPGGAVLGMLSTHFRSPHRPSEHQLSLLDLYARQAVELIDRLRADQALRESEERFRRALQPRNVGIVFITTDGIIHEANDAFLEMSGFTRTDFADGGLDWKQLTPPEWREAAQSSLSEFGLTGLIGPREHDFLRRDGSHWYALCSATRIAENEAVGYIIDITDRKRAEQALRDADRRKDEFLATLAHELRNPLAPISNAMHLLKAGDEHRRRADRLIEMVQRQVRHIVRLVDDLLEVSRITRGKIELRRAPADLADIVHAALEANRPLRDRDCHRLYVDLPAQPLILDADRARLIQVFSNLLNNAVKYTGCGGEIWLIARREGEQALITVRDTGIGINPTLLPRVFDMFVQGDSADANVQGGLGIGLTMSRALVELHGGSIDARSEGSGHGCEFVVRLPLLEQQREQPQRGSAAGTNAALTSLAGRRVLVVDDNRDAADSLGLLLSKCGAEVRVAYDGKEALAVLDSYVPHTAIVDIGMPEMDGYQLAERIRRDPRHAGLRLVALTGWGQSSDRARTQACGFDAHLTKPAEIDALTAILTKDASAWDRSPIS
jgi:PAS domain S-box-containing protein